MVKKKLNNLQQKKGPRDLVCDYVTFNETKSYLGGNVKAILTTSESI